MHGRLRSMNRMQVRAMLISMIRSIKRYELSLTTKRDIVLTSPLITRSQILPEKTITGRYGSVGYKP